MQSDEYFRSSPQSNIPAANNGSTSSTQEPSWSTLYQWASNTLLDFGISAPSYKGNANDPFDYEQKYPPDEEFEEMSPKARAFKVYVDESVKMDFELVNGWREGLDMLLIFAALFSAVVTSFIVQTCQSLKVDNVEVGNSLMSEMISVQPVEAVPPAVTSFRAQTADRWVNGLWFTSLGLSLATTLLAVLAKQWIHQYMTVPSVSPRTRCRIRHFRYKALEKWRVPLIIELLPVLMHAALGLFFIGLVVYLRSLSTAMAVGAFAVYLVTTILPVFYPDCAYKTPLSVHSFTFFSFLHQHVLQFFRRNCTGVSQLRSLRLHDIELETVERQGHDLDASALGWLFNISSNLSIQSIMIQALSGLPLQSIPVIGQAGPEGIPSVVKAINDLFHVDQPVARFERLQRAALRFQRQVPEVSVTTLCKEPSKYSRFCDTRFAIPLVEASLFRGGLNSPQKFDVVYWANLFSTALQNGIDWLEIDHDTPSEVWSELLRCAVSIHVCARCNCNGKKRPLLTFPTNDSEAPLCIDEYDLATNGTSRNLGSALTVNMLPSFLEWVLRVGFPDAERCDEDHTKNLPTDMFLCLLMVQMPSIQKTSSLDGILVIDDPRKLFDGSIDVRPSLFRVVLDTICGYTHNLMAGHADVNKATMTALQNVMGSDTFGDSTIITFRDEALVVKSVFEGLNWHLHRTGSQEHTFSWLTSSITRKVISIAFIDLNDTVVLLSNIMSYLLCSSQHFRAIEAMYTGLLERRWLQGLAVSFTSSWCRLPRLHVWGPETGVLAASYVDGLAILASHSPDVYDQVLADLGTSGHLSTICKTLLLSDVATQSKLWKLAKIVKAQADLKSFSASDQAEDMHSQYLKFPSTTSVPPQLLYKDIAHQRYSHPTEQSHGHDQEYVELISWFRGA
ncbi:hypothetical protein BDZ89DRAFT_1069568 [Hymenopellis radicata]|nr:hypothetical protein BDZ89DRAFT_1069568 [Hymenopellis radicata]